MAEIVSPIKSHSTKRRPKKLSTRVDLTPMVDLGFLLITFFIFTTSMSEPKAMKLKLPADTVKGDSLVTVESKTFNILLLDHDRIGFYKGSNILLMQYCDYGGIRSKIIEERQRVGAQFGDVAELVVLIKPTKESCYQNVMQLLDEMLINNISRYVLMDPSPIEIAATK